MPKLPEFKTDEEAAEWFDQHDSAPFMDELEEASEKFEITRTAFTTRPVDIRLRSDYLAAIQAVAERKGVPYQRLVQTWLMEKLNQEAPDLLPQSPPTN
jgi:predicted DNA binding CopG/RHH family protein